MKYNLVVAAADPATGCWLPPVFTDDDREREDSATAPNPVGFYHYPATMSRADAWAVLRDCMVMAAAAQAESLVEQIKQLKSFRMETSSTSQADDMIAVVCDYADLAPASESTMIQASTIRRWLSNYSDKRLAVIKAIVFARQRMGLPVGEDLLLAEQVLTDPRCA